MIQKGLLLDSLEEKAIFRWFRFFYHLLVAIGGFGVLGGLLLLLYSLTPTFKDTINSKPEPAPVKVTAEAVKAAIQPYREHVPLRYLTLSDIVLHYGMPSHFS